MLIFFEKPLIPSSIHISPLPFFTITDSMKIKTCASSSILGGFKIPSIKHRMRETMKSKKVRQYNGQKKENKRTNNVLKNIIQKTKD
jgi:hypothetical protein